jgi:hypothetical protein
MATQLTDKANERYMERQTAQNRVSSFERAPDAFSDPEWTDVVNSLSAALSAESDRAWHKWLDTEWRWTYGE